MKRKRLSKLLMGLGVDRQRAKEAVDYYRAVYPGISNQAILEYAAEGAAGTVKDIYHAREKAFEAYDAWCEYEISDGEMVRQIRQKLELTKHTAVVTINKKEEEK